MTKVLGDVIGVAALEDAKADDEDDNEEDNEVDNDEDDEEAAADTADSAYSAEPADDNEKRTSSRCNPPFHSCSLVRAEPCAESQCPGPARLTSTIGTLDSAPRGNYIVAEASWRAPREDLKTLTDACTG